MPDETAAVDTTTTEAEPTPYVFPFPVPADLSASDVTDETLRTLHSQVREHGATFAGLPPAEITDETVTALQACRDLAVAVAAEVSARRERTRQASALAQQLADVAVEDDDLDEVDPDAAVDDEPQDETAEEPPAAQPAAVTAAAPARTPPRVRDVAGRRSGAPARLPAETATPAVRGSLTAAADLAGYHSGQELPYFAAAGRVLAAQLERYPSMTGSRARGKAGQVPVTMYEPGRSRRLELRNYSRQPGVELRRDFPAELRFDETADERRGYAIAQYAADERRLFGGSLLESVAQSVKAGRSLTAAAGWCAPSDNIYTLVEYESNEGLLDAPQLQTPRGGWNLPIDGGTDFSVIWGSIGNSGDTHLTEAEVIAESPAKVCTEIPCPDFDEVRLDVDYYCLTGGLLQRRGYPEAVARFARGAATALVHKVNAGFIASIVAGSGAAHVIGSDPSGDDAASSLLSAIDLAIVDMKYRNRMGLSTTMEVVLPWWVLVPIRAAMARRTGVAMVDVTDAQILGWFASRHAVPRLVYDWQDSFAGLTGGPGAAAALTALPLTVQFLVYPSGTWVKAVQSIVSLDTIYDSTLLATNQYTAIFVEDGWAALKMGPLSRLYTAFVDPSGVVGCCPGEQS